MRKEIAVTAHRNRIAWAMHVASLGGILCSLFAGQRPCLAAAKQQAYAPVKVVDLNLSPTSYEGRYLKIKDYFHRALDSKRDRDDRRVWRRKWIRSQKMTSKQYVAFYTDRKLGSGILCYVPRTDDRLVKLVQGGLARGEPILLQGRYMRYEFGLGADEPDLGHFMVDAIYRGHDDSALGRKLYVAAGKQRQPIPRTGKYEFPCPKCGKKAFTIRLHGLVASFDLTVKCPHPNCGKETIYRFTME